MEDTEDASVPVGMIIVVFVRSQHDVRMTGEAWIDGIAVGLDIVSGVVYCVRLVLVNGVVPECYHLPFFEGKTCGFIEWVLSSETRQDVVL